MVGALGEIKPGGLAEQDLQQGCKTNGSLGEGKEDSPVIKVPVNFASHSIRRHVKRDSHTPGYS